MGHNTVKSLHHPPPPPWASPKRLAVTAFAAVTSPKPKQRDGTLLLLSNGTGALAVTVTGPFSF
jgi:hypothetical protein